VSEIGDPRFDGLDFERSFLLGVIYDDESLTLEMDFNLTEQHPRYIAPQEGESGCYRGGYIRFAGIDDLQIGKAPASGGELPADYSVVHSVSGDGERFLISTGWGDVKVSARSVRIALD
jgi:hypothetical protein